MRKPKINQKKAYNALGSRLDQYVARVQSIYDELSLQTARIAEMTAYDGGVPFLFADYPEVGQLVEDLKTQFVGEMRGLVMSGTSAEWKRSNVLQDLLAKKVLKYYDAQIDGEAERVYFQANSDAMRAFQNRAENGWSLSDKLWNQSGNYVREMEFAISSAIEKGMSAVTLSKRLSQYLSDFDRLKADYGEKYGQAVDCADCEYRSIRLARSEINMAYRAAEQERWKQFDFITGYEIKLSGSHPREDICDFMVGQYPKDFVFSGWHPNCLCMCLPIIMNEDDYWKMREGKPVESQQTTELPESFKDYVRDNQTRIQDYQSRGTEPYWVKDNAALVSRAISPDYLMTDSTIDELESIAGFNKSPYMKFGATDYNLSPMRGFDLMRFDKSFESLCDRYEVSLSKKECIVNSDTAKVRYIGQTPSGGRVNLEREFVRGTNGIEVNHSHLILPEELQGKGVSKEIFRYLFREYGDMGVSRINLTAGKPVGAYCWAKYGFCAEKSEAISVAGQALAASRITKEEYDKAVSLINGYNGNAFPMNLLANAPFGVRMLKDPTVEWNGFLDMKESKRVRFMKDYVGYPRKI